MLSADCVDDEDGIDFGGRVGFDRQLGRLVIGGLVDVSTSLDNREESVIRSQGPAPATNAFILVNPGGTDFQRSAKFEFQALRHRATFL